MILYITFVYKNPLRKDKYCILTIYTESENGTEVFAFTGKQWRNRQRKQTYGHGGGEERVRWRGESNMETYIPYVK